MTKNHSGLPVLIAAAGAATLMLAGCGPSSQPASDTAPAAAAAQQAAADAAAADEARAAELAAKEQEIAEREAALQQQQKDLEAELARRDAENAAAAAAAAKAATPAKKPATKPASTAAAAPKAATPPTPITVPAGTTLAIQLSSSVGTKQAVVGDPVKARLASDLVVDGRKAASAGATVTGSVTKVVSGTAKVGGTPELGLAFNSLVASNGTTVPISAHYTQKGVSETGKDTAKIVGGAAAGAIIGNQVNSGKGAVVGGILGGAAGTGAAHKTGGDVKVEAGTVINVATQSSFTVTPK